jgi:hypothetical protein
MTKPVQTQIAGHSLPLRFPTYIVLIEQPSDISHRSKQLHGLIQKGQKTFPLIKTAGIFVLRVDDHRE